MDDIYDFGYGDSQDVSTGGTGGFNYDFGYGNTGDVSVGQTGDTSNPTPLTVTSSGVNSDFLSRLFSGTMTSGDKAGAMLGLGALAIAQSLANKPPAIKQPVYKQAPVYNRALTAPMYGMGYLDQRTNKQVGMGMPLFFNPNPFQFDPTEAAKKYGPTPEEIAAGQQVYTQKLSELYTPRSVPDVPMTGGTSTGTTSTGTTATPTGTTATPKESTIEVPAAAPVADGMKRGGFLNGRGDGMSDEIHATINQTQPARLSDGEFVVPADVVAHLGNGSSKAGAQRLYEMMARVRKARTGTTKQAPEIKAEKFV